MVIRVIKLKELIASPFYSLHNDIKNGRYTHYWLKGGRGSTKSSFISVEIILNMMLDENAKAVCLRKVGTTLKDSIYTQLEWAIEQLGVGIYWKCKLSPLEIVYLPTGQKILFRGADDPKKLKSTKFKKGYCKYVWYEETAEFDSMEEIRNMNQSLMRGGDCVAFYSFNPPESLQSWVNKETMVERPDTKIHHSTYLGVPAEWLGQNFIVDAEHLKATNPERYEHEYLGIAKGTGGEVFKNITLRSITDEEIENFDHIHRGLDWGYATDPLHYTVNHYDKTRRRLYIFYEIHLVELSNRKAAELIKTENKNNGVIVCDSAEPKSIAEVNSYGLRSVGAKKGPDSIEYGIKHLQDLEEIIIDPVRCPNTAREFTEYELEKDKEGNFKARFPDKNNHSIDAVRYSLWLDPKDKVKEPPKPVNFKSEAPRVNVLNRGNVII